VGKIIIQKLVEFHRKKILSTELNTWHKFEVNFASY